MNEEQTKALISWLNDAHAMELALVNNMGQQAKDATEGGEEEAAMKIEEHIKETRKHAELVESCITRLGGSVSGTKDLMAKGMGFVQGTMKSMFSDVMVKNAIEAHFAEHMEIAAYTSLITAAQALGDQETVNVCRQILADEEKTAGWTMSLIEQSTKKYIESL